MWIFLFFFSNWERSTAAEACGQSTKNVWSMWKAYTRARVDTKWLVYYRNRWLECVAVCFHVVAVAWARSGWVSGHAEWRHGPQKPELERPHGTGAPRTSRIMGRRRFVSTPCSSPAVGPSSALVLIAAVTRGRDESNPRCERSPESLSPVFFRARTQGAMFSRITRVGYNAII